MPTPLQFRSIGQGQPLVLIHGWGVNSGVWQPLAEKLSKSYQVNTIDLPGFGVNVNNTISPYSLMQVSKLIVESIGTSAVYIGWSLGGLVASNIAINYPDKVQGLVTVASSPCFLESSFIEKRSIEKGLVEQTENSQVWPGIKPEVLTMFHQQLSDNIKKTLDGFLRIQAMGSPHIRHDIKQLRDLIMVYPIPSKTTLEQSLQLLSSEDLRADLSKITAPFLRLYGKLDGLVPKTAITCINDLSPNSDYYIFNKASHAPFISHLDEFSEQLLLWLNNHICTRH